MFVYDPDVEAEEIMRTQQQELAAHATMYMRHDRRRLAADPGADEGEESGDEVGADEEERLHEEQTTAMRALGLGNREQDRNFHRGRRDRYPDAAGRADRGYGSSDDETDYTDSQSDISAEMPFTFEREQRPESFNAVSYTHLRAHET